MNWYSASILLYFKFKDGNQNYYPLWENVLLISAENEDEALEKAEKIGKDSEGDTDGSLIWDNRPATKVFVGIRKLMTCVNHTERPKDGTEITYSQFLVNDYDSLVKLAEGESVEVLYEE